MSFVWQFFTKTDANHTKCNLCPNTTLKFSDGSTSAMRNQLKSVDTKEKNDLGGEKDGGNSGTRPPTLTMVARSKAQLGDDMYNRLNRALALACALD